MTKESAEKLMLRPVESRWVNAPSPRGVRWVAGVIISIEGDVAKVRDVTGKVKDYYAKISEIRSR